MDLWHICPTGWAQCWSAWCGRRVHLQSSLRPTELPSANPWLLAWPTSQDCRKDKNLCKVQSRILWRSCEVGQAKSQGFAEGMIQVCEAIQTETSPLKFHVFILERFKRNWHLPFLHTKKSLELPTKQFAKMCLFLYFCNADCFIILISAIPVAFLCGRSLD